MCNTVIMLNKCNRIGARSEYTNITQAIERISTLHFHEETILLLVCVCISRMCFFTTRWWQCTWKEEYMFLSLGKEGYKASISVFSQLVSQCFLLGHFRIPSCICHHSSHHLHHSLSALEITDKHKPSFGIYIFSLSTAFTLIPCVSPSAGHISQRVTEECIMQPVQEYSKH